MHYLDVMAKMESRHHIFSENKYINKLKILQDGVLHEIEPRISNPASEILKV